MLVQWTIRTTKLRVLAHPHTTSDGANGDIQHEIELQIFGQQHELYGALGLWWFYARSGTQ